MSRISNYKYNVNDVVNCKYGKLKICELTRKKRGKAYRVECLICGYKGIMDYYHLENGCSCPICNGHQTLRGYNDLWTTRPDVAKLLFNPEDGFKYKEFSSKHLDFKCPCCNNKINNILLSQVSTSGLSCPKCGKGISYPNKFMFNLLKELNIDFEKEKLFTWCKYYDIYKNKETIGYYDFVIESMKLIIEMDSSLGHGNYVFGMSNLTIEETKFRDFMKDKLAQENGYKIIRIICPYNSNDNRFNVCKQSVIDSKLYSLFDFSQINWGKIKVNSEGNIMKNILNLYNTGVTTKEIANKLKIHQSSVINYLHRASELNISNYIPYSNCEKNIRHNAKPIIHEQTGYAFDSGITLQDNSKVLLGISVVCSSLYNNINKGVSYKKHFFKRITKQEFNDYKSKYPEKTYGDFFKMS